MSDRLEEYQARQPQEYDRELEELISQIEAIRAEHDRRDERLRQLEAEAERLRNQNAMLHEVVKTLGVQIKTMGAELDRYRQRKL